MDGRDAMPMSGPASYYVQRRLAESGPGSQPVLHAPPAMQALSNASTSLPVKPTTIGGGSVSMAFHMESSSDVSQQGLHVGIQGGGGSQIEPVKRKRGRPRKYRPDGGVSMALSSMPSPIPAHGSGVVGSITGFVSGSASGSTEPTQKRGRGRPAGTGKKQRLASYGEWISSSAGVGFTPHIITISAGEDIASKIMSFSQQGSRAICVLSANGAVSTVTLRQPATSGGAVTYEGRFEILGLFGSYLPCDDGGSCSWRGDLSISLSSPDGRVIGGGIGDGIGGMLIAASPVQVVVGSFTCGGTKAKINPKAGPDSSSEAVAPVGDIQTTSSDTPPEQSHDPLLSGWPGSRHVDTRNTLVDIDLTRG
uniref:AT-hook motif nuclear-localized protein n=1 Tax=Anthurium amnicola TaxID=1678845 RepID=A0A1D1XLW4_9ARAE